MAPTSSVRSKAPRQARSKTANTKSRVAKMSRKKSNLGVVAIANLSMADVTLPDIPAQPSDPPHNLTACDFLLELHNYIPAGCLRLERHKCQITEEVWSSCDFWHWLGHPREVVNPNVGPLLSHAMQEAFFVLPSIMPYRNLHQAGWVRLAFKMRDAEWGQIRVYLLPDDIGRRMIDRADQALRKSLRHLMGKLDTARDTWEAGWSEDTPVEQIDLVVGGEDAEPSLFRLFNTLPSPNPKPSIVKDSNARSAMEDILSGKIVGLKTNMMPYQRRSAALMLQKEAQPAKVLDPRLRKCVDQEGIDWYCDLTTGTCLRTPRLYEAACGGICAETMGLGKTLICLSLILATRELSSQIPPEYSVGTIPVRPRVGSLLEMSAAAIGRTGTPWRRFFRKRERDGAEYAQCKEAIRRGAGHYLVPGPTSRRATRQPASASERKILLSTTSLVVVPANLLRQWEGEIEKHTTGLKVLVMKPQSVLPPAAELCEYDIILFSRPRFEKEASLEKASRLVDDSISDGQLCSCIKIPRGNRRPKGPMGCTGACAAKSRDRLAYESPLRGLHFKRLITDEGHTMGNSSGTNKTNAVIVVDFLQISARWIVSGTPTKGLYGAEGMVSPENEDSLVVEAGSTLPDTPRYTDGEYLDAGQERKDLEKLGNIATMYLKSRPWSNSKYDDDSASWSQYVMQPRHGSSSQGNLGCLQSTLEGMIIRHRPEDVMKDVVLPPLFQKTVYLEGCIQDKLSLNMFSIMIISNAVTSERRDADYLFHPQQRRALSQLVGNLRQASFFWAGISQCDVEFTIRLAKQFLSKPHLSIADEDRQLLTQAIQFGETALTNSTWLAASETHEMPYYVRNAWSPEVRNAYALDGKESNPTLIGSTQLLALQRDARRQGDMSSVVEAGRSQMELARAVAARSPLTPRKPKVSSKAQRKLSEPLPNLAGGLTFREMTSPSKKRLSSPILKSTTGNDPASMQNVPSPIMSPTLGRASLSQMEASLGLSSIREQCGYPSQPYHQLARNPFRLGSAATLSTASSKLSYLINQVLKYHESEKIIIFYEAENVAYYAAQAFELLEIEHLIYAKSLPPERRSQYIFTFNQNPDFRVLLMDISQAAFGLDISAASRVYFINPPVNKQVEAQAVKRAHRIGQFRPVYVETLVLRGSIEEVIVERKKTMSSDENQKCKTVLDDQTMYDWIKNVKFVTLPEGEKIGPEQMATLEQPQPLLVDGRQRASASEDPDAGLVMDMQPSKRRKTNKTHNELDVIHDLIIVDGPRSSSKGKRVGFLDDFSDPFTSYSTSNNTATSTGPSSPYNPTWSSPTLAGADIRTLFSNNGGRESSPSKADRSRLNFNGAKSLLAKLKKQDESVMFRDSRPFEPSSSQSDTSARK